MGSEEKKLAKNTLLLLIGNFSSKLLVFFLVPLYTSVLSTAEYATSDLITTTINLVYPFATLMISTAVLRLCLDKYSNTGQLLSVGIWTELVGFLLVAIGSVFFFNNGNLEGYRIYFLAGFAGYSFYTLLMEYTKGCERVGLYSFAGVCNTIVLISCNVLFLLKMDLGIKGYLSAMIVSYWITVLVLFVAGKAWKDFLWPTQLKMKYVKAMLVYSVPLIPNSISWWISNSSDRYIMNVFRGLDELGLYSVAYKIPSIMATISGIMVSAWEISAVDNFGSEQSRRFYAKIYDAWVHTYVIVCVLLILSVKLLALLLFQNSFFVAWRFVPILLFASVFSGLSGFLGTVFTSAKKTNSIFVTTMLGAGVNIVLNFLLIPFFGGYGAAAATAIGYLVIFIIRIRGINSILRFTIDYKEHFLLFVLLFLMVITSCMGFWINYILGITILIMEKDFIFNIVHKMIRKVVKRGS